MIAILSDIHGNLSALESVVEDMKTYGVSSVISLGDVCGYYPFINESIELLTELKAQHIIGNHDRYIMEDSDCPRSSVANECLKYQRSVIKEVNRDWLWKSVGKIETENACMVHGGLDDNEDEYIYIVNDNYFSRIDKQFFFCGHTHVQKLIRLYSGRFFVNPGSVGQPRDGINKAAYCLYDESSGTIHLRRVAYKIDIVAKKMRQLGFSERFYENLYCGARIGLKIDNIEYNGGK